MSSNNKKYTWLLLIAYVMMAMHSFTPHVHHDHDEKHDMHQHGHGHDHENDGDQTTDLQHGFAHFLHNGGNYDLFSKEHSAPLVKELSSVGILLKISNSETPSLPVNDLPPPGWTLNRPTPVIFLSPCGLKAPPLLFLYNT